MADLLNRANVDTAINTLLDDAQPNEAIQPSDHNGLLKNILDTLANGLSVTLRTNPETAGQDVEITSGDKVKFKNSTFFNSLITDTLTADRTLTLPNKTGTIAILSDIQNLFTNDLTLGANRSHNAVEYDWKITHNATDGSVNAVGIDTGKISHEGSRTATNSSYSSKWWWGQFSSVYANTSTNAETTISQTNSVLQLINTDSTNDTTQINLSPTVLNLQHTGLTTQSDLVLQGPQAKLINMDLAGGKESAVQLTNTNGSFYYSTGNTTSYSEVNNTNTSLSFNETGVNAGGGSLIISRSTGHEFTDNNTNGSGLEYNADYSANYTSRSLVDKAFVLANAGGDSIYTADGTLSGNRTVTHNNNNLNFDTGSGLFKVDDTATIGKITIGPHDRAIFSHKDYANTTQYALHHSATGYTLLNTFTGKDIQFTKEHNTVYGKMTDAGKWILGGGSFLSTEKILLDGHSIIKGADTLSGNSALQIYNGDTTPAVLWDFRNNGDVIHKNGIINIDTVSNASYDRIDVFNRLYIGELSGNALLIEPRGSASKIRLQGNLDLQGVVQLGNSYGLETESSTMGNLKKLNTDFFGFTNYNDSIEIAGLKDSILTQYFWNKALKIGTNHMTGITSGKILDVDGDTLLNANLNMPNLPTSSAGLSSGDVWNDGGTLKIV